MCRSHRRCPSTKASKAAAAKRAKNYRARRRDAAAATAETTAHAGNQDNAVDPESLPEGDVTPRQPEKNPRTQKTARKTGTERTQAPRRRTRARGDVTRGAGRREVEYFPGEEFPDDEFADFADTENGRVWMAAPSPVPTSARIDWGRDDTSDTAHDRETATDVREDNPMSSNDNGGTEVTGDVTPPSETAGQNATRDTRDTGGTESGARVINYAAPGATVGRQADVVHGAFVVMGGSTAQSGNTADDAMAARMRAVRDAAHRRANRATSHTTTRSGGHTVQMGPNNVAGTGDVVAFQIGSTADPE